MVLTNDNLEGVFRVRVNLKVPFAEKDSAKALGAKWDATKKIWYIVDKADLTPFLKWIAESAGPETSTPAKPAKPVLPVVAAVELPPLPRLPGVDYDSPPWEVTDHDIILKS